MIQANNKRSKSFDINLPGSPEASRNSKFKAVGEATDEEESDEQIAMDIKSNVPKHLVNSFV